MTLRNEVRCDKAGCKNTAESRPNSVVDLAGWLVIFHQEDPQMVVDAHLCPECRQEFFRWLKEPRRLVQ